MTQDKRAAARAARELLLNARLPVIDELSAALRRVERHAEREAEARAATIAAEEQAREVYASALRAGWSSEELRKLRLMPPPKRAKRSGATSRRAHRSDSAPPPNAGPAPSGPSAGAPQLGGPA
ncbi:hypothetical protein [Prauserella sp. PE36]|uniref:hypothetical protein n=1 Tax=Prauserella sp. PE36 TaxID=1504709 RepID=UPI0011BE3807|nr:hypothetical protein [Prauserella sp. PE36]